MGKLVGPLVQSGLGESAHGREGGLRLGRPAAEIMLREIYIAINGSKGVWTARKNIPRQCLVSSNIEKFFRELDCEAGRAVLGTLEGRS